MSSLRMENFVRQLKSAIALSRPFFAAVIKRIFRMVRPPLFKNLRHVGSPQTHFHRMTGNAASFRSGGAFPATPARLPSRASLAFYNTEEEVDFFIKSLDRAVKILK